VRPTAENDLPVTETVVLPLEGPLDDASDMETWSMLALECAAEKLSVCLPTEMTKLYAFMLPERNFEVKQDALIQWVKD
jgi:hypothetical protein